MGTALPILPSYRPRWSRVQSDWTVRGSLASSRVALWTRHLIIEHRRSDRSWRSFRADESTSENQFLHCLESSSSCYLLHNIHVYKGLHVHTFAVASNCSSRQEHRILIYYPGSSGSLVLYRSGRPYWVYHRGSLDRLCQRHKIDHRASICDRSFNDYLGHILRCSRSLERIVHHIDVLLRLHKQLY